MPRFFGRSKGSRTHRARHAFRRFGIGWRRQEVTAVIKSVQKTGAENPVPDSKCEPSRTHRFGEKLARNLALTSMLALTIAAVHNAALPSGQTLLAAVQEMIDPAWDESLGKIRFVSNWFPETVAVFFESDPQTAFIAPCFGGISHAWSEAEPYVGYVSSDQSVYAAAEGQVMSVAHGMNEERIVRVRHDDGLETLYYNLASVSVREGDRVTASTCLGQRLPREDALIEVRRAGRAIDPSGFLAPREAQP